MANTNRGAGRTITAKGYVRITAGPHRHMMEHRRVTAESIEEFCPPPLKLLLAADGLPVGVHVHHSDWKRQHNCGQNLQLLQDVIHEHISHERTAARRRAHSLQLIRLLVSAGEAVTLGG